MKPGRTVRPAAQIRVVGRGVSTDFDNDWTGYVIEAIANTVAAICRLNDVGAPPGGLPRDDAVRASGTQLCDTEHRCGIGRVQSHQKLVPIAHALPQRVGVRGSVRTGRAAEVFQLP